MQRHVELDQVDLEAFRDRQKSAESAESEVGFPTPLTVQSEVPCFCLYHASLLSSASLLPCIALGGELCLCPVFENTSAR